MNGGAGATGEHAGAPEWADRFDQQARACGELGSPLYARLLHLIADEIRAGGATWDIVATHAHLRFGQAGPLRLVGAAHRLALGGEDEVWASVLPSCGGTPPPDDGALLVAWRALVVRHTDDLVAGLAKEVQTNEVARAAGLALALARTGFAEARLVELGCSGALNLRLDHFSIDLAGAVLGDVASTVRLAPEIPSSATPPAQAPSPARSTSPVEGPTPERLAGRGALVLPRVTERVGIDPHPVDVRTEDGRTLLLSFVWPDQAARLDRARSAIDIATTHPARLLRATVSGDGDTADVLAGALADPRPTVVQHSIVWQYVPTDVRWRITEVLERAGAAATAQSPLAWVRYEPDEWDRRRAAVWLRTWPTGGDRLIAHVDFHGRWIDPL